VRHVVVPHQHRDCPAVNLSVKCGMGAQCLQFRPEQEALSTTAVIQGFNSEPIADEVKFAVFRVPEREGKHPDKGLDCPFESPCLNRRQHDLGIRMSAPPAARQFLPEFLVVVDFSIENDDIPGRGRDHGLVPFG